MKTKKEIKQAYKEMKFIMGVFAIRNLSNDKIFVDNSQDITAKWNRHQIELKFGNHRNKALQKDWAEHGTSNFTFELISELKESKEENTNYPKELVALQTMALEELKNQNRIFY